MNEKIPKHIPACAFYLLGQQEWFADTNLLHRVQLTNASRLARFISSESFAQKKVAAITLGKTIHIRMPETFDIHSINGLVLLAHELKHVEQIEREGIVMFCLRYLQEYRRHGYGAKISYEAEAIKVQNVVQKHLLDEFSANRGIQHCADSTGNHLPNEMFVRIKPQPI